MAWHLGSHPEVVVAFVGQEQARQNRGIPLYHRHYWPKRSIITIQLIEVLPQRDSPQSYAMGDTSRQNTYLWFTPNIQRKDPCAGLNKKTTK